MGSNSTSKSDFKAKALEYLRRVEATGDELVITDRGRPVVRVIPYMEPIAEPIAESVADIRETLRGTVLHFDDPTEPVAVEDWEALR